MGTPNLFDCGTSELSQDAFLVWLMSWANYDLCSKNAALNALATDFVKLLLEMSGSKADEINIVKSGRKGDGFKDVDVWAIVNDKHLIIIEDKTKTSEHSDQLNKYAEEAKRYQEANSIKTVSLIYYKSGNESSASYRKIESKGYKVLKRTDMLELFGRHDIAACHSDILSDYVGHLRSLENRTQQFRERLPQEWTDKMMWQGFYMFAEQHLDSARWRYVPNKNGGFWCLGFGWQEREDCEMHVQIEQGNLCFKIYVEDKSKRSSIRTKYYEAVMAAAKKAGYTEVIRPDRFGYGDYMTIALVPLDKWVVTLGQQVDFEVTVAFLKKYGHLLNDC